VGFLYDAKKMFGAGGKHGHQSSGVPDEAANAAGDENGDEVAMEAGDEAGDASTEQTGGKHRADGPASSTPTPPAARNEPDTDPNEDIAAGTRPVPARGATQ
jgi:hypothetical protein